MFLPRCPAIQLSLTFRPVLDTFGARALPPFFPDEFPSSTRIVVLPCLMSFGGFSTLSRNLSLFDFFCAGPSVSGGGVGGLVTGTAFRISSGRRAGRADRRVSWMVDPCRVAELSDKISSGIPVFADFLRLLTGSFFLPAAFACCLRRSSSCLLFSFCSCSTLDA